MDIKQIVLDLCAMNDERSGLNLKRIGFSRKH